MNSTMIIEEISELLNIPEIENFFFQKLLEAKEEFKDEINCYLKLKSKADQKVMNKHKSHVPKSILSSGKSYFFELNRVEDSKSELGHKWEIQKFKLKDRPDIVKMILHKFIEKADTYEINTKELQSTNVLYETENRTFEINFLKSCATNIVGFVKEIGRDEKEAVLKDIGEMRKVKCKYQDVNKEEIYDEIFQLMNENPEFRDDIFVYFHMVQKSTEKPLKEIPSTT